jgi:hypothetical protein
MASSKPQQTVADYVTIALTPLLIMALVGSLVFFLLEVLYVGQYSGRLQWTLFFFVFGMVLIARISIEQSGARAALYGLGLGVAVWVALQAFVEFPEGNPLAAFSWAIDLGLMALIWWCAHRLTWDCTYIDDQVDASGKGVLQAAGLDQEAGPAEDASDADTGEEQPRPIKGRSALLAWWDRYERYRQAQRRKPHTPGVWVVYFSLAALPLFGLGQALIPPEPEHEARRRYVFWLMVCYVGSGLGLLLTTSYLGLRRYLRQRKLQMPVAMTGMWLGLGAALILVLMIVGALIPRPYGEYQLTDFTPLGSKERTASKYALKTDSSGKEQGRASTDPAKDEQKGEPGSGTKPDKKEGGSSKSDSSQGKSGQDKSNSSGQQGNQGKQGGDRSQDQQGDKSGGKKDQDGQQGGSGGRKSSDQSGKEGSSSKSQSADTRAPSTSGAMGFLSRLGPVAQVLKWIVFGILALAVVFFLLRSGLGFLANFTNWAKSLLAWWQGLFGRGKRPHEADAESEEEPGRRAQPRPFRYYTNPFLDGRAEQMSPTEVACYTFAALESWAWERDLGRQQEETPLEFSQRLGGEVPALEGDVRRVASLYARAAYGRGVLGAGALAPLRQFWQHLEAVAERPLSA